MVVVENTDRSIRLGNVLLGSATSAAPSGLNGTNSNRRIGQRCRPWSLAVTAVFFAISFAPGKRIRPARLEARNPAVSRVMMAGPRRLENPESSAANLVGSFSFVQSRHHALDRCGSPNGCSISFCCVPIPGLDVQSGLLHVKGVYHICL